MNIIQDLTNFYNAEAKKYHQTRKKHRSDALALLKILHTFQNKHPKILELGCGGGRFTSLLSNAYTQPYSYTGIDISKELLACAKNDHPDQHFICSDMESFLRGCKQESFDIIVACSSFQHLPSVKTRLSVLELCYKALKYEGILIFTNRSLSHRFIKTYWKALLCAILKSSFTIGNSSRRDILIPRETTEKKYQRYYHIFGLSELKKLIEATGFSIETLEYLDKKGEYTKDRKNANNTLLVAKKTIFLS